MQDTTIAMYKVLQTKNMWPPPTPEAFPAAEALHVHEIAEGMGCMPVGEPRELICHRHETVATGILRLMAEQNCQKCLEEQFKEGNGAKARQTKAWSLPEHGMLKQPITKPVSKSSNQGLPTIVTQSKASAHLSLSLPSSPFVSLKQEESSLDTPTLYSTAANQHISPYPSQGVRPQSMRQSTELDSMGNHGYSRNTYAELPTPTYSEPDYLTDNGYLLPPAPPTNNHCPSAALGPQCYDNCGPFSSMACDGSANFQQFLPNMGGADSLMASFLPNNDAGMVWDNAMGYSQPNM